MYSAQKSSLAVTNMEKGVSGLYAITDDAIHAKVYFAAAIDALLLGGAKIVQYRDKSTDVQRRFSEAQAIVDRCKSAGALSIINDDVELARSVGADGVHLGRSDQSIAYAREVLGVTATIGVSCYNRLDLAQHAAQNGADYVAVGSVYPSITKPDAIAASYKDLTTIVEAVQLPVVAIGGITIDKISTLHTAGVSAIAVISAMFDGQLLEKLSTGRTEKFVLNSISNNALSFSQEWSRCEQI